MKAVTYDFHPKHVLEPNGLFEWEKVTDVECYCGHKQNSHLDGIEICLNGLCICEKFGVDSPEVVISPKAIPRKNLPKKFAAHFTRN